MTKKGISKKAKLLTLVVLVGALVGISYILFANGQGSKPPGPAEPPAKLAPATDLEKQESAEAKKKIDQDEQSRQQNSQTTASGKRQVVPIITSVDSLRLSAYVPGVFEEGGTCTAVFTQGSTRVTRQSAGFQNASYTQCAPITPSLPNKGFWSVYVTYSSTTAEGQSKPQTFEVQ